MPEKIAFRMTLNPGQAKAYEQRHDDIFPDLVVALKSSGILDYSIWLDPETHHLFAVVTRTDDHTMDQLPDMEVVKRWWAFMADIMLTDANNVPDQKLLPRVFHLS